MSEPTVVLESQALAKHYAVSTGFLKPKARVRALDGVSFTLAAGRTLAVVGESGCGKSTLARQLTMIEAPTGGALLLAHAGAARADVTHADAALKQQLRRQVQMVFQNPFASLNPRKKIAHALEEPLAINTDLSKAARGERARAMMARVGLRPEHDARYPHMFSGGQRQRIAIARALMLAPAIVVLDEPVSALDVSIQAQVLNLLRDLRDELGLTMLFVAHELGVVRYMSNRVAVMYLGRIMEIGSADEIFGNPRHPYTQSLLKAVPRLEPVKRHRRPVLQGDVPSPLAIPSGCRFRTRCPLAVARCAEEAPAAQLLSPTHSSLCHFSTP